MIAASIQLGHERTFTRAPLAGCANESAVACSK
jgi:hypothetical protein